MKKVISVILIAVMGLLVLASCGNGSDSTSETASTIIANYSIKNSDDSKDFIVEVQDLGGVYSKLYDKFKGGSDKIYDSDGKEISRDALKIGATLEISYDGKIAKKSPKTIKAYKVTVIG